MFFGLVPLSQQNNNVRSWGFGIFFSNFKFVSIMKKVLILILIITSSLCYGEERVQLIRNYCSPFSWGNQGIPTPVPSCVSIIAVCGRHRSGVYIPYMMPAHDDYYASTEQGMGEAFGFYFNEMSSYIQSVVQYGGYSFSGASVSTNHRYKWTIQMVIQGSAGVTVGAQVQSMTSCNQNMYWYFYA
jgi:hypothetical protein